MVSCDAFAGMLTRLEVSRPNAMPAHRHKAKAENEKPNFQANATIIIQSFNKRIIFATLLTNCNNIIMMTMVVT